MLITSKDGSSLWLALLLACVMVMFGGNRVLAQSGGPYDLRWSTVDAGGHTFSVGGAYALGGTGGQPDAGLLTGGPFTLGGGFWTGGALPLEEGHRVYLPLILRGRHAPAP